MEFQSWEHEDDGQMEQMIPDLVPVKTQLELLEVVVDEQHDEVDGEHYDEVVGDEQHDVEWEVVT